MPTPTPPTEVSVHTLRRRLAASDAGFTLLLILGAAFSWYRLGARMDVYDTAILFGLPFALGWLAWQWRALRWFMLGVAAASLIAINLYQGNLARAEQVFWLKYWLSSQSAILWMCVLFLAATILYWVAILRGKSAGLATATTWAAVSSGTTGLMVRWYESYLIGPDVGHIPVSNLYEVFVLFALITALFYLYDEARYRTRALGGFALLVISAAVGFLLWYAFDRAAHEIQPLVPALQSWWMKLHVPANFIGYGTFSLAAMVAFAYLIKVHGNTTSWKPLLPLFILGVLLGAEPLVFRQSGLPAYWMAYFGVSTLIVGGILLARRRIAAQLPSFQVLDDWIYKAISVGFAFFTVATVLGALWAAEAWGAYWQWDPKETWALIVWLNYAAWLHMRLIKGLRGDIAAYWALIGLLITGFAFLGVNMFLSGLHSYGTL